MQVPFNLCTRLIQSAFYSCIFCFSVKNTFLLLIYLKKYYEANILCYPVIDAHEFLGDS